MMTKLYGYRQHSKYPNRPKLPQKKQAFSQRNFHTDTPYHPIHLNATNV